MVPAKGLTSWLNCSWICDQRDARPHLRRLGLRGQQIALRDGPLLEQLRAPFGRDLGLVQGRGGIVALGLEVAGLERREDHARRDAVPLANGQLPDHGRQPRGDARLLTWMHEGGGPYEQAHVRELGGHHGDGDHRLPLLLRLGC